MTRDVKRIVTLFQTIDGEIFVEWCAGVELVPTLVLVQDSCVALKVTLLADRIGVFSWELSRVNDA